MWQVHCTAPRTIWHFWAQPPLFTLQFSAPVRGPVPAEPEMGAEPRILPQAANLAFHLGHEEQLPGLLKSLGKILFELYGWGSATNHGPGPPTPQWAALTAVLLWAFVTVVTAVIDPIAQLSLADAAPVPAQELVRGTLGAS